MNANLKGMLRFRQKIEKDLLKLTTEKIKMNEI